MNTLLDVDLGSARAHELLGTVVIHPRFNGPRRFANGGYASGRFASFLDGPARVVLRAPVPLGKSLTVTADGTGGVRVASGRRLIAEVLATQPIDRHRPPIVPTLAQAEHASRRHPFADVRHEFGSCFVCSPHRYDGLGVVPGPLSDDVNGALFRTPNQWWVASEMIWAALDCVSYPAAAAAAGRLCLLGTLAVTSHRPIAGGEILAAVGWTRSTGNRSTSTSSALVDEGGAVVASADAIWVAVRRGPLSKGTLA